MNEKEVKKILDQVLEKVEPPESDLKEMKDYLKFFVERTEQKIKKLNIKTEVFIGGSFAKKTLIKKDKYDIDVFLRFDKKYSEKENNKEGQISEKTRKILDANNEKYIEVKGSREYFRMNINERFSLEIIPVIKVNNSKEAENITDLSYSHVKYINKKLKYEKILNEIKITKAFCYGCNAYGAESYIKGFSGYALELLIYYYGSFLKFIKEISKVKQNEKIIIYIEKFYKNKQEILMNLNSSKLQAPIVLIDPTYKQRNVTAALSEETFKKFQYCCREFLKKPSMNMFEIQVLDLEKIKENAKRKKLEFCLVELKTDRQEGDIAGTKLLKFYEFLKKECEKYFEIKERGFSYDGKHIGKAFFVVKSKKEILSHGPRTDDKKNVKAFKKMHKKTFVKGKNLYAKEPIKFNIKGFFELWKKKNITQMLDMDVNELNVID